MKKKYHTVRAVSISNRKIVEISKIDNPNIQMHARSLFWLGTGTIVNKNGSVVLLIWA